MRPSARSAASSTAPSASSSWSARTAASARASSARSETAGCAPASSRRCRTASPPSRDGAFDCVVLDVGESATIDLELVSELVRQCAGRRIPVVLAYSEVGLSEADREKLDRLCRAAGVKPVRSLDRLVDQALLYLHRPIGALSAGAAHPHRAALRDRRGARRQEGPDRRRRHPQHLRDHERPRAAAHGRHLGRDREGGHREAAEHARNRLRPDGHHDAGHGRLRHDAGDPQDRTTSTTFRSSPSRRRR